jgi:hypothetical protein
VLRRWKLTSNRRQGVSGNATFVCRGHGADAFTHSTRGGCVVLTEGYLLVHRAQPLHLGLESVDTSLELLVGLVEGDDVVGSCNSGMSELRGDMQSL